MNCQTARTPATSSQSRIFGRGGAFREFRGDAFGDHKSWEYDIGHLVRAVRAHRKATTTKAPEWSEHCDDVADYFEPDTLKNRMQAKKMKGEFHDPQQMTILRYRVRFDVAAMMIRRKLFDEQAHFFFLQLRHFTPTRFGNLWRKRALHTSYKGLEQDVRSNKPRRLWLMQVVHNHTQPR